MEYYKAYDERYKKVHSMNQLWETKECSKELINVIEKYKITKQYKILDLGCGEGRDTIKLLNNGYNVLGVDYSINAINMCNRLTNNKYFNNFKQLDILKDELVNKYDFIYSISVLHMLVLDKDRNNYLKFIYNHLEDNGLSLITVLGNGTEEYTTNINNAFKIGKRININTNEEVEVANTTCRIVNFNYIEQELQNNKLKIIDKYITHNIINFNNSMCLIVKKENE